MQESRLFKIVYYLLENSRVTANELAEKFEVSVRTIYRDIDRLSGAGIPVYCTKGKGGGIFLLENYVLNKEIVSKEEQFAILSSLQGLSAILPNQEREVIKKLNAIFKNDLIDWIEFDFSCWGSRKDDNEKFEKLKNSILNKKIISFVYINSKGEKNHRTVKPLKIHFKFRAWYLQAFCMYRNELRFFKINRISNLDIKEEEFDDDFVLQNIDIDSNDFKLSKIKLKFSKKVEYRVYDEFDINTIVNIDDDFIIIEVAMPQDNWLIGYLMSFCGNVEIIEPKELKIEFKNALNTMYEKYNSNL